MKTTNLFGMLLLFLCTMNFASCSDGDEQEHSLALSRNSCEVMQGYSVSIDLTAHENTTLNVGDPALIDAVYTWGLGGYKAKIEIRGKQKGETDLVVTDHETGESAVIKVKVTAYPMPRLAVKQSEGNMLDAMSFYLYTEDSKTIDANHLPAVCDSIVWTVDGMNGSFRVFEYEEGDSWVGSHLTSEWDHCFKYPGEYATSLTAWKDNKEIFRDQLSITVADGKDFLAYNWSDITKDSQAWDTYVDVFNSGPDLMTTYGLGGGTVPFAEVRIFNSDMPQSYHALYDYFCKLYSAPTYEDKKMWQQYDKLFSEQKKYPNACPMAIWVAERANMVLLLLDESTENPGYVVYAEPNRQ